MHWRSTCRTASARAPDLSAEETVEQSDRVGKLGNGGHKRRRGKWIRLRSCSPDYAHILGEGSIPVPLPPPDRPSPAFSGRDLLATEPKNRNEISFELWIPDQEGRLNILQRAHSSPKLWTLPIRYGPPNSNVLSKLVNISGNRFSRFSRRARASDLYSPSSSSIPPAPATHSGVRPGSRRDARMGRKSRLFAHSLSSLDSRFAGREAGIAKSLRSFPRIFPFWGDFRWRRVRSGLPPEDGSPTSRTDKASNKSFS